MSLEINIFNSVSHLEPHCPTCKNKIEYGISTSWNDKFQCHQCNTCKRLLK